MIWLLIMSVLSPESIMLSGYPGSTIHTEIRVQEDVQVQATYPLEVLSYEQPKLTLKINSQAHIQNYSLTTYVIQESDSAIRTAVGIPTQLEVVGTTSTQAIRPTKNYTWAIIVGIITILFASGAVRIQLR